MTTPKIISSNNAYSFKYLSMIEDELQLSNGLKTSHLTIMHPGAVVILPLTDKGTVLFVRQYRHSVKKEILELPAGKLNAGEDIPAAALRELQEETGFSATSLISLEMQYPVPGFCSEMQHTFLAKGLFESKLPQDDDEVIDVVELSVLDIESKIVSGELNDGKSIAIFMKARLRGFL